MLKKHICFITLFAFIIFLLICPKCFAKDLDEIVNYEVVVEPRMNDGSLDIIYQITWKVLDSKTEGPLEWVQIGTPNANFDNPTALTRNIRSITPYNGSYVKIVFNKKYYAGEQITFKYKIHQAYMYNISFGKCKYSFTPAWFTDAKTDKMTVKWNMDEVKSSNAKSKEDNYLVWTKTNMTKGEKIKINVKYDKDAFGYLSKYAQNKNIVNFSTQYNIFIFLIVMIIILAIVISLFGGGYYWHRGFYGGYYGGYYGEYYGRYYDSSCACACACARSSCASSCACACAGSGRAGCSKKDFYGTKINKIKLKKALK